MVSPKNKVTKNDIRDILDAKAKEKKLGLYELEEKLRLKWYENTRQELNMMAQIDHFNTNSVFPKDWVELLDYRNKLPELYDLIINF